MFYLFQAAHEVVADRRSRQVGRARAPPDVEKVVRAQHGVVLLRVTCGGQDPVHGYRHLDDKAEEKDTLCSHNLLVAVRLYRPRPTTSYFFTSIILWLV